jgi:hypothetical protein
VRDLSFFALSFLSACSVDLAEPAGDDGGSGTGAQGSGGISSQGGSSGGTPAGGFGGFAGSGAGGSGGVGLGGSGGGSGGSTDPCTACIQQKCPVAAQCDSYPACGVMSSCISSCTTPDCQVNCYNADQTAYDLYFGTLSCVYLNCPKECVYLNPTCFDCEELICKSQKDACFSSQFCIAYWYCVDLCTDSICYDQCDYYWLAGGGTLYDAYGTCSFNNCGGVCT